jgi:vacuolar-type H+-ATPase subunit I/STV1
MSTARIERLTWYLIFGGLALFGLGFAVQRGDTLLGCVFIVVGAVLALAGAVLVWLRSRMPASGE